MQYSSEEPNNWGSVVCNDGVVLVGGGGGGG